MQATELEDLVQMLPKRARGGDGGTSESGSLPGRAEPGSNEVVRLIVGAAEPKHPPPTWAPNLPSATTTTTWMAARTGALTDEAPRGSANPQVFSVASEVDQVSEAGSSASRNNAGAVNRNVEGLSQLLHGRGGLHFPWWHSDQPVDMVFHTKTRLKGGKAALLVDPGAHGNLCGELTMTQLVAQAATFGHKPVRRRLSKTMSVEGVGKQAQIANYEEEVVIGFRDIDGNLMQGKFSAPVIGESSLPPLWGRQSLAAQKAVLDLGSNRLIIPGKGGIKMQLSPGSMVLPLTLSESGHLLLEVHHFGGVNDGIKAIIPAENGSHSFKVAGREGAKPSN